MSGTSTAEEPVSVDRAAALQRTLDEITSTVALAAVAHVCRDGYHRRFSSGVGDLVTGRRAEARACFRAGSVVKTFIATAVLQLVAEDVLRLDDTLDRWLPGVLPNAGTIRLRHLLNHTSGVCNVTDRLPVNAATFQTTVRFRTYTPRDLVGVVAECSPEFAHGTRLQYSNTNYILLALVLEKVTNERYEHILARQIITPLGLRESFLPGGSPYMPGPHLRAYAWRAGPEGTIPLDITVQNPSRAWASGDLISTTGDLSQFLTALFTGKLLPAEQMTQMLTPVEGTDDTAYGLGLLRLTLPSGLRVWGSTGAFGGYVTFAVGSPDGRDIVIVSVTPRSGAVVDRLKAFVSEALDERC